MIRAHQEMRTANDDEDGNKLGYGFLKSLRRSKGSSLTRTSLKFCKMYIAVASWTFFKKLLLII